MLRFLAALLPHVLVIAIAAFAGAVAGFVFDLQALTKGGMGPAAAHVGAFVLFLLAAVPALLAAAGAWLGLFASLVGTLIWDGVKRRWRRRSTVRTMTLAAALYPLVDLAGSSPEGGWTVIHFAVVGVLSLLSAFSGCLLGLLLVQVKPLSRSG